jgi:hypothetical protein
MKDGMAQILSTPFGIPQSENAPLRRIPSSYSTDGASEPKIQSCGASVWVRIDFHATKHNW